MAERRMDKDTAKRIKTQIGDAVLGLTAWKTNHPAVADYRVEEALTGLRRANTLLGYLVDDTAPEGDAARASLGASGFFDDETGTDDSAPATLSERLAADGVTLTYTSQISGHNRTFCGEFHFEGRTLAHEWRQSANYDGPEPTVTEILAPALRFAMTAECADSYQDWASDWTSNPKEYMPEDTYRQWLEIAKNLRAFLGDDRYESYSSNEVEHDD